MMQALINLLLTLFAVTTDESLNRNVDYFSEENNFSCTTSECVLINHKFERKFLRFLKKNVDPCENFYEFVCGNDKPDNADKYLRINTSTLLNNKYLWHWRSVREAPFNFLSSCGVLNRDHQTISPKIESKRVDYLKKIISGLGGWPVLEGSDWNDTEFDWTEFGIKSERLGIYQFPFVHMEVIIGANWTLFKHMKSPHLEFDVDWLSGVNFHYKNHYRKYIKTIAKIMGATSQQFEELNESLEFEMKLIDASSSDNSSRKYSSDDLMSVEEIKAKWPSIDWSKFFSSQPKSYFYATNETKFLIKTPVYITNFEELVRETPKRVLANYAVWKIIQNLIQYVGSAMLINAQKSYHKLFDSSYEIARLDCGRLFAEKVAIFMIPYISAEHPIDKPVLALTHQIISGTHKKMIEIMNASNKFDSKAINDVVDILNAIKFVVGQTDADLNVEKVKEYYRGIKISNDSYLHNYLSLNFFVNSKICEDSVKPKNSIDLKDALLQYNPKGLISRYNKHFNTMCPKLLKSLWFSEYLPNYVNYATLGFIIGHELGHSVDSIRRKVNIFGDLENGWSAGTNAEYEKTEACLIDQFNDYFSKSFNQKHNGSQYLHESVPDLIGIKVAYSTYQDFVQKHGVEAAYSSLPYNSNQLFWISYVTYFCDRFKTERGAKYDNEPPNDIRIIAMVSNSPEFARDFNCPLGSKMNRQNKCDLF